MNNNNFAKNVEIINGTLLKMPSLRANFIWTLVGNGTYAASQWGILILISKLGTVEIVGKFTLALAITAPVIIFSNLALRSIRA